jgi:hypothetical protein
MVRLIQFPLRVSCNRRANRNLVITLVGGLIVAVLRHLTSCRDCTLSVHILSDTVFFGMPVLLSYVLIRDRPADITFSATSIEIQPISILGLTSRRKITRKVSEFSYLTFKPVLGGPAIAGAGQFVVPGARSVARFVLRGKPGLADVVFDPPDNVNIDPFGNDMRVFRHYWRRLGKALKIETRDEIRCRRTP